MAVGRKWAFPSVLQQSNHETMQKDTLQFSPSHSQCAQPRLLLPPFPFFFFFLLFFFFSSLFSSLAALGCSPVSLKPISSITEIIFLPGHVFVQREWISQLSEAVENREERLWVTAVCVCVCVCVCLCVCVSACVYVCVCTMLLGCSWLLLN